MGVRIALIVLTGFASAWAFAALQLSGGPAELVFLPIAISLALLAAGWRGAGTFASRGAHVRKVVALWSSIEMAALFATAIILQRLHRAELMMPLGAIIVGLHFFPLGRGIPVRVYHATGAGLVAVGVLGLLVPPTSRPIIVGFGAALTLWWTALILALRAKKAEVLSAAL